MENIDNLTPFEICAHVKKNAIDNDSIKKMLEIALDKAVVSSDYTVIACTIAHEDCLNDKIKAEEVFKLALDKAEDSRDLTKIATNMAFNKILGNKKWARHIFEKALGEIDKTDIEAYLDIASEIADADSLNDKSWSKIIFEETLDNEAITNSDIIQIAQLIADESILNDKIWASKLIERAGVSVEFSSDYLEIAFCLAQTQKLNQKDKGRQWFELAVQAFSQYEPEDYFDIAKIVSNDEVLNDKDWAIELCLKTYENIEDSDYLLNIACFVADLDKERSKPIFWCSIVKAKTPMELLNIACNIALPNFLNDKKWASQVFDKALSECSKGERILIESNMEKYL